MKKTKQSIDDTLAAIVRLRYERAGVFPGWPAWRFVRLCKLLSKTAEEVGWLAALTPGEVHRHLKRGIFSPPPSLHFAGIEAVYLELKCGRKFEPVMPTNLVAKI